MAKQQTLAVLVSGSGTLLEAMIQDGIEVAVVAADRECRGLEIAEKGGIATELVKRESFKKDFDRPGYTHQMVEALQKYNVDVVAMAGFMTVLSQEIFDAFPGKILNSHPALLPSFKGGHAVRDALAMGVKITGTTIHVANLEVDEGEILAQACVEVKPGDTEETLHERIKVFERKLYPEALRQFLLRVD